ncbi:VOC family protein [Cognatishimia sp. MH4019]|uniref:VOC family protein n=1 Tax=Cognatishimia sp. MH4019 TaxID=2854030 RepID=UPI001CD4E5A0|nr:VOC family protein [Cognatishimia sp. MH4019]
MSAHPPVTVKALGEIAIRCADLAKMTGFYRHVVGLEVLQDFSDTGIVFFKIADGYGGHTSVLALFGPGAGRPDLHAQSEDTPETGARSSLHHIALTVDFGAQDELMAWLEGQGVPYRTQVFDWIGWRGVFIEDPEGNTVEFVAADKSLLAQSG